MRRLAMCCCAVALVACSKSKDQPATDEMGNAGSRAARW